MTNKTIISEFHADLKRSGKMQEALNNLCDKARAEGEKEERQRFICIMHNKPYLVCPDCFDEELEAGRQSALDEKQEQVRKLKKSKDIMVYTEDVINEIFPDCAEQPNKNEAK